MEEDVLEGHVNTNYEAERHAVNNCFLETISLVNADNLWFRAQLRVIPKFGRCGGP